MQNQQGGPLVGQTSPACQTEGGKRDFQGSNPELDRAKPGWCHCRYQTLRLLGDYVEKMWIERANVWPFLCSKSEKQGFFLGYVQRTSSCYNMCLDAKDIYVSRWCSRELPRYQPGAGWAGLVGTGRGQPLPSPSPRPSQGRPRASSGWIAPDAAAINNMK